LSVNRELLRLRRIESRLPGMVHQFKDECDYGSSVEKLIALPHILRHHGGNQTK